MWQVVTVKHTLQKAELVSYFYVGCRLGYLFSFGGVRSLLPGMQWYAMRSRYVLLQDCCHSSTLQCNYPTMRLRQEEKENIRKYMEMVAQREAKAEEERLRKKVAADAAFKAVVEQTEKQNNEEDELRMLRWVIHGCALHLKQGWRHVAPGD